MEDRDAVDLKQIKEIVMQKKGKLLSIVVVTTLLAMAIAFLLPKQYESTTLLRAKSQKQGGGISLQAASALAILGGGGVASPTQAYIELMKSRTVLDPIIAELDIPSDVKEKMDNKSFAKSNLKITNTKGTDLIEITAIGKSPEEAQYISGSVVASFQKMLTTLNQSEQSLMLTFLNGRIAVAKQDLEKAEQKLEKFRQQEKIYVPDEQAKAAIKKLTEYDQKIAQYDVMNKTNQAKLQGVNEQLQKQNIGIGTYQLADNLEIQEIRSHIAKKQMELVALEQRYTDKHPSVILVRKEMEELNRKLKDIVEQSIATNATTLNPIHSGIVKAKVETETELLAGQASVDAMRQVQSANEKELSKLSAGSLTYIGLERQARVAQEVYAVLVKNYEQTRIQEAMESMDIQIVDQAHLPKRPSAPKKLLITAMGGVLGIVLSFGYVLLYLRRSRLLNKVM